MADTVTLMVPPRGEYAKTVRLVSASLATRAGMSFEQVEDVRMAAEEAFVFVSDRSATDVPVHVVFEAGDADVSIEVSSEAGVGVAEEDALERAEYARFILEAVCDELDMGDEAVACRVRLVVRVRAEALGA